MESQKKEGNAIGPESHPKIEQHIYNGPVQINHLHDKGLNDNDERWSRRGGSSWLQRISLIVGILVGVITLGILIYKTFFQV